MATVLMRIPRELIRYLRKRYTPQITRDFGVEPKDSFLVCVAYYQILSYETGKEFEILFDKKKNKLYIK